MARARADRSSLLFPDPDTGCSCQRFRSRGRLKSSFRVQSRPLLEAGVQSDEKLRAPIPGRGALLEFAAAVPRIHGFGPEPIGGRARLAVDDAVPPRGP